MQLILTYRSALFLGTLIFCALLTACDKLAYPAGYSLSPDGAGGYGADKAVSAYYSGASSGSFTPSGDEYNTAGKYMLYVRDSSVKPGDSIDTLIGNFGEPGRVVSTEYDFELYVYNNTYTRLLLVAVKDNMIIGFYTDSEDFYYNGIAYGERLEKVNKALGKSYEVTDVLTYDDGKYSLRLFIDVPGGGTVTGIYLLGNTIKEDKYTDKVKRDAEQLLLDLTNSIRARHDLPLLSWSSSAALSSRKHSLDMAENSFFSHIGSDLTDPGLRLNASGISYVAAGENIIAGYYSVIYASHAWFNSPEHRKNILDERFCNIGIGFEYLQDSIYKTYITQAFYR